MYLRLVVFVDDVQQQLELEDTKKLSVNVERITTDYQQMKADNTALIGRLKQQQQASAASS